MENPCKLCLVQAICEIPDNFWSLDLDSTRRSCPEFYKFFVTPYDPEKDKNIFLPTMEIKLVSIPANKKKLKRI